MNVEEFSQKLLELMPQIMKGMARHENNYLTRGKITFPQSWVLLYLVKNGEVKMSSLAEALGVSKPSATGTVDRLIAQGFVNRRHDEKDRRIVWIALSSRGKKIINDIVRQRQQTTIKIFRSIPEADRIQHLRILEQVVKALNAPEDPSGPKDPKGIL